MEKEQVLKQFKNPGKEFRGMPFWSWNGDLKEEELIRQMKILKEMGFGGFFMHSRTGLETEYLGEEWFRLINAVTDAGVEEDMEAWLYDEDRWPSGSAGGIATRDPQYRIRSLVLIETPMDEYVPNKEDYAVFAGKIDGVTVSAYKQLQVGEPIPAEIPADWKVLVFRVMLAIPESVYNGATYLNTLSREATDKFIEVTHEAYQRHCGDRMGTTIKGIFTDEPHNGHLLDDLGRNGNLRTCSIRFTEDIFEEFKKRYGYDALPLLPELFYKKAGAELVRVKHDYVDLGNALFLERFIGPMNDWSEEHNMQLTGHVLHEDFLSSQTVPQGSLMRTYEYMGLPGVDVLFKGNDRHWIVKQLASSCRQLGKTRLLSELYGCTSWEFDFKGHKAMGDWQALFGINLRCPHLSWYTMEGECKRDYPASILHQSTYYKDYNFVETYFARFGFVMSQGRPLCDVLVINPVETLWARMFIGWADWIYTNDPHCKALEKHYEDLCRMLTGGQIDFDYGDEEMMSRLSRVEQTEDGAVLRVGLADYKTVVVSGAETLRSSTCSLLKEFMEAGGKVIFAGALPTHVDAELSGEIANLTQMQGAVCVPFTRDALIGALRTPGGFSLRVTDAQGADQTGICAQARYDEDTGNLYVALLNTQYDVGGKDLRLILSDNAGGFLSKTVYAQEWCLADGKRFNVEIAATEPEIVLPFDIEPAGEKIFVFNPVKDEDIPTRKGAACVETTTYAGPYNYRLDEQNVCVLDFAEYRFQDGDWQPAKEVLKVDQSIRAMVGIEPRSGNMLQPWYSKLNDDQVYGDAELRFTFYADQVPAGDCYLAVERPDLCHYSLNGTALVCENPADFWIDICFKKLKVPAGLIQAGKNEIVMKTAFRRTTNIEAIYLVGDFGVRIDGHRASLTTLPAEIDGGELKSANLPFYTGCISYLIPASAFPTVEPGQQVVLRVKDFRGSLAKVGAAGEKAEKVLAWNPYEADITEYVQAGKGVEITLVPSRRNMFGPLHMVPEIVDALGPQHFVTAGDMWDDDYRLVESRLGDVEICVLG